MDGEKMTTIDSAEAAGESQCLPSSAPDERRQRRSSSRRMVRSELLGHHSLTAKNGVSVSIYQRDGRYIVRGFLNRRRFGETLPSDPQMAEARLVEIITEIGNGTYRQRSEARRLPLKRDASAPRSFREIANEFLAEKRRLRGKVTADTYRDRLARPIQFLELPHNIRRWRWRRKLIERVQSKCAHRCISVRCHATAIRLRNLARFQGGRSITICPLSLPFYPGLAAWTSLCCRRDLQIRSPAKFLATVLGEIHWNR